TSVGDDRVPAEGSRGGAQRLCRVDRPIDEETRWRSEDVREDASALELDDPAVTAADQLVGALLFAVEDESLRTVLEIGEDDRAAVVTDDLRQLFEQRGIGLVDPDVDLATARQPDAQREIIGDSVGEQL